MQRWLLLHFITCTLVLASTLQIRGRDIQYKKWSLERQCFEIILDFCLELLLLQYRLYKFAALCSTDKKRKITQGGCGFFTVTLRSLKRDGEWSFICPIQQNCIPLSNIMPTSFGLSFCLRILELDSVSPLLITESKKSRGVMKHWPPISKLANNSNL